jgi:hypothetical protein
MARIKRSLSWIVRIAALMWLVVHFAMTLVYVMPFTPIKVRHTGLLDRTIGTYFQQNWSLFAPNPLSNDQALIARCLSSEEGEAANAGKLPTTGWHDLSTPFWSRFQQNRFSAYDRLVRPQSNAIREFMAGSFDLGELFQACKRGQKEACKKADEGYARSRKVAGEMLKKIGSSYCLEVDPAATHVALGLQETPAVPWSKRYSSEPAKTKEYSLDFYPIDRTIATMGLHAGGNK